MAGRQWKGDLTHQLPVGGTTEGRRKCFGVKGFKGGDFLAFFARKYDPALDAKAMRNGFGLEACIAVSLVS